MESGNRNLTSVRAIGAARLRPSDVVVEARRDGAAIRYAPARNRVLRVLVADDNPDAADSLAILVRLWDHDVRVAYAGAAALQLAFSYHPHVLLLDISMPELNGYDLARRIRQEPRFDAALVIAVTGHADVSHQLCGEAAGFDRYLVKPIDLSDLEMLLRREHERLVNSTQGRLDVAPEGPCGHRLSDLDMLLRHEHERLADSTHDPRRRERTPS